MKNIINELVYEDTYQVEKTMNVVIRSHCYDNSHGKYTLAVEVHKNGLCEKVYIGGDALNFLSAYHDALEEI